MNPELGGVASCVQNLHDEFLRLGMDSEVLENKRFARMQCDNANNLLIAHGLWQWPGEFALDKFLSQGTPYVVFPHGMLDPWFKKSFPLKHLKKQIYWWYKQSAILQNARAVCFTTEEEKRLAKNTFLPYRCREVVTGLGVADPTGDPEEQVRAFLQRFPELREKRILLYLGRFHRKKGVDLLIDAWKKRVGSSGNLALVLGGPVGKDSAYLRKLRKLSSKTYSIYWTDMLEADLKWGALHYADALILPSHQENYGMVIAEACAVGTPVLLTDKVNLWREVLDMGAGLVARDDQQGISSLLKKWVNGLNADMSGAARACFIDHLHVKNAALRIHQLACEA